ncbi:MAG TPA: ketopantoate reductase C-terminal domain-containing protein [Anaerolineales bacterium]|nr:ketopantoate reductase C-terminal domain-containing protein [Anaerolineales bacterium]
MNIANQRTRERLGAVVREGKMHGIPTPVNQMLTETLMALTKKEIPLDDFSGQPEKLLKKLAG